MALVGKIAPQLRQTCLGKRLGQTVVERYDVCRGLGAQRSVPFY